MDNASRFPNRELLLLRIYQMLYVVDDDYWYFDKELCNARSFIVALSEDKILSRYLTIMITDHWFSYIFKEDVIINNRDNEKRLLSSLLIGDKNIRFILRHIHYHRHHVTIIMFSLSLHNHLVLLLLVLLIKLLDI